MLFSLRHTLSGKELIQMKRLLRAVSAFFTALLLVWYCMPQVYRVLHLPDGRSDGSGAFCPPACGTFGARKRG